MRELLLEIWTSVRHNKLRTFLTGFSVAWGIFMLVILLGSGNGLKNGVLANFDDYATNSIDLGGGQTSKPWMGYEKGRRIRMRNSDLEILRREFPEVEEVAANSWFSGHKATYGREFTQVWLHGSLPKVQQIEGIKLSAGRFINEADVKNYRKVIVIDEPMRRILFKGADPVGKQIKVGGLVFTVIGIEKGDAQRNNSSCHIPLTTGQLMYKGNDPIVNNAIITVRGIDTDEQMEDFEKRLISRLAAAKKSSEALNYGDFRSVLLTNKQSIFERKSANERVLVAINADSESFTAHFDAGCGTAVDLLTGETHDFGGGSTLPPYSAAFWKMEH